MAEPGHDTEQLALKLSIEINELFDAYDAAPSAYLLERIDLKEQLLEELLEFMAKIEKKTDQ